MIGVLISTVMTFFFIKSLTFIFSLLGCKSFIYAMILSVGDQPLVEEMQKGVFSDLQIAFHDFG